MRDVLVDDCKAKFRDITENLANTLTPLREIPGVELKIKARSLFNAQARGGPRPRVVINDGLLLGLYNSVERNRESILKAVLAPVGDDHEPLEAPDFEILDTVYDLAISIVLTHEIQHIFCGHLDHASRGQESAGTLDESSLSSPEETSAKTEQETVHSYYLEMEADDSACELLLATATIEGIERHLLSTGLSTPERLNGAPILEYTGVARILAFRLFFIGLWIALALTEIHRKHFAALGLGSHPFPAARLIGATNTVMMWYGQVSNLSLEDSGELRAILSSPEADSMREFVLEVLKPVLLNMVEFPDSTLAERMFAPVQSSEDRPSILGFVDEFYRLLRRQDPLTSVGRQLRNIEARRIAMRSTIAPYRYFKEMLDSNGL